MLRFFSLTKTIPCPHLSLLSDWEFPGLASQGGTPDDKENLSLLLQEFRAAFDAEVLTGSRQRLYLCLAVTANPTTVENGYITEEVHSYVDS